jgi:hypothetical protein
MQMLKRKPARRPRAKQFKVSPRALAHALRDQLAWLATR